MQRPGFRVREWDKTGKKKKKEKKEQKRTP
jgi:hypothetical protein